MTSVIDSGDRSSETTNQSQRQRVTKGADVTPEVIKDVMKDAPILSQQAGGVSLPRVQEYVDRLLQGEIAPPIKVDGNILVDGNHRYIAAQIVGIKPEIQPWSGGRPDRVIPWSEMKVSLEEWSW